MVLVAAYEVENELLIFLAVLEFFIDAFGRIGINMTGIRDGTIKKLDLRLLPQRNIGRFVGQGFRNHSDVFRRSSERNDRAGSRDFYESSQWVDSFGEGLLKKRGAWKRKRET